MLTEEKRLLRMLYLLSDTETYKKANELAGQLQVSERTVKNDVEQLKELARKNGCRLEAVRGKGYTLKIEDAISFQQAKESLDILFSNTEKGYKENPVYRIARAVMMLERADAEGYFRLEDLADALHISESDMKKKMAGVREFLGSFNLTLQSRPGRGLRMEGDEMSQRLCLLELYENHFRKRVVTFQDQKYEDAFADREDKEQVRNAVLWSIRNSSLKMFDSFVNRLVNYMLLMRNRMKSEKSIHRSDCLWGQYEKELLSSQEYRLAEKIMGELKEFSEFQADEDETAALCVLLQMWADLEEADGLEERFPEGYQKAGNASRQLAEELTRQWNLPLSQMDDFTGMLIPSLLRIFLQARYGYVQCKNVGNLVSDNRIKDSVLSMVLADQTVRIMKREWGISVNEYNIQLLAVRFFRSINGISYSYIPRRLLICARNGRESARIIADGIKRRLGGEWIGRLTINELYEGRKYSSKDYDCLIGSFQAYAYRYTWPYIEVGQIPQEKDYERIRKEVMLKGYDIESVNRRCQWDVVWVHRNFAGGQIDGLFQLIAYQWGKDTKIKEQLARYYLEEGAGRVHNHMMALLVPNHITGKRIFEVYFLKKSVYYMKKSVKTVVFVAVDFRKDPQILRYLEQILRVLSTKREELEETADSENIMDILTNQIREEL